MTLEKQLHKALLVTVIHELFARKHYRKTLITVKANIDKKEMFDKTSYNDGFIDLFIRNVCFSEGFTWGFMSW